MPKDKSFATFGSKVRYSSPLSPWGRCNHTSYQARLHSREQERRTADNALELSLEQLERHLRTLNVVDNAPECEASHRHRRPKKRVRFCSPSPAARISSLPEVSETLPPILIARNSDSWRVVPIHERQLRPSTPPPPYTAPDLAYSETPPEYSYGHPPVLIETLELQGDQWTVVSARYAD